MIRRLGISILAILAILVIFTSCKRGFENPTPRGESCDFNSLTITLTESYGFNTTFADQFSQSTRWESYNADITLVNEKGQLSANSENTSQALEAWKLYKIQMPYNSSWEISVDVIIPNYWNSNGGKNAQVGAGIFVGKPVASGQSPKVYECNMAVVNGGGRFVQAQLIANRLGDDPINVQYSDLSQTKESARLKIQFCTTNKSLTLFIDDVIVGSAVAIDEYGLDNWNLSDTDVMDVGIMGFAEKTTISVNQPTLDNFNYKIY